MAHTAADGSRWTNASQARKVPGRAQGDGKQPVSRFSKPEAPRESTAEPVTASPAGSSSDAHGSSDSTSQDQSAPTVEVTQDGNMFVVTAKYPSAEEAHAAAGNLSGVGEQMPMEGNPAQAMM